MRIPMNARSARSAVLGVAVFAALATGGLAYGSAAENDSNSTAEARIGKAAPPGTVRVPATTNMVAKQGVKPSRTTPKQSTAEKAPSTTRSPAHTAKARDVDKSDKGVKGAKATKDRGKKNAASTRDRGAH
jgi:hypothetical protein